MAVVNINTPFVAFFFVGHLVLSLSLKPLAKARLLLYNSPKRFINHIFLREGLTDMNPTFIKYNYLSPIFESQRKKAKGFIIAGSIIAGLYAFGTIYSLVLPMELVSRNSEFREYRYFTPIFAAMIIPGLVLLCI